MWDCIPVKRGYRMASTRTTAEDVPGQDGVGFEETDSVSGSVSSVCVRIGCSAERGGDYVGDWWRHDCLSVEEDSGWIAGTAYISTFELRHRISNLGLRATSP
jgi:hypothetical protein